MLRRRHPPDPFSTVYHARREPRVGGPYPAERAATHPNVKHVDPSMPDGTIRRDPEESDTSDTPAQPQRITAASVSDWWQAALHGAPLKAATSG